MRHISVLFIFAGVLSCFGACSSNSDGGNLLIAEDMPSVLIAPGVIDFNSTVAGDEEAKTLSISNTGPGTLEIYSITMAESDEDELLEIIPGDDWRSKVSLEPTETIKLTIRSKPLNDTPDSATITIRSNDPAHPEVEIQVNATP